MSVNKKKVVALVSGGLDSTLAMLLAVKMGFEVIPVHIITPFNGPCCKDIGPLLEVLDKLNLKLRTVSAGMDYVQLVKNPKYGYGRGMNPCIDCRIYFFKLAKKIMEDEGAVGVVTGEVLNQRPKSQTYKAIKIIEKESGLEGRVIRPLSGFYVPPTELLKEGIIKPEDLLAIKGRSRKAQIQLAKKLGLNNIPNATGGCLLTYESYAKKLKDLFEHDKNFTMVDIQLLKIGRHFRLDENTKLIVGRNQQENDYLESLSVYVKLKPKNCKGPVGVLKGSPSLIYTAAEILASYCDGNVGDIMTFSVIEDDKETKEISAPKKDKSLFKKYMITLN